MIILDGQNLTLEQFIQVVRFNEQVVIAETAREKVIESRKVVDNLVREHKVAYGITTGFGKLSDTIIDKEHLSILQEKLIKSHAVGVGNYFSVEITRGIMLLRINALIKGVSGIRIEVIDQLVMYLNNGIHPAIPEQGSLGASGDLAPLSHMAITLIGEGEVLHNGEAVDTLTMLNNMGLSPLDELKAKDGLSLINGTQAMTSVGAICVYDAINISKMADVSAALTMEALYGIKDAFYAKIHEHRPHPGQVKTASNMLKILEGSNMITSQGEKRTQDAYSIRCIPQVHGATKDALAYAKEKIEVEMNSATDNPLIFDDYIVSAGNFHGQPMAITFDFLKVAVAELASISERRIERLVNASLSEGLPPFLVSHPGLNSGFMILQYSAASLVSENKVIAHPASVDSIPSSANQEDHVSMGTIASRNLRDILENVTKVIAMEMMASVQAIDLRENVTLGQGTQIAYDIIRKEIQFVDEDIVLYPLINKSVEILKSKKIIQLIEESIEELNF